MIISIKIISFVARSTLYACLFVINFIILDYLSSFIAIYISYSYLKAVYLESIVLWDGLFKFDVISWFEEGHIIAFLSWPLFFVMKAHVSGLFLIV